MDRSEVSRLTLKEIDILRPFGSKRTYQKGSIVISSGDDTSSFFVILDGGVEVYEADEQGKQITLNMQRSREYFGELAIIGSGLRSAFVRTKAKSSFLVVSKENFEHCLKENPSLMLKITRHLAFRVRALTEKVRDLALLEVYARVVRFLNRLVEEKDGRLVIANRPTHQVIANEVGASREMISRVVADLERGEYLVKDGKNWMISGPIPKAW